MSGMTVYFSVLGAGNITETLLKWVTFILWKCKYHAVCQTVLNLPHVPALLLGSE